MKSKITKLVFFLAFLLSGTVCANAQIKESYTGKWDFVAPDAPDEYKNGIIEFKSDTALITFTGGYYNYPSKWIKAAGDSVFFESDIDGTTVYFSLKTVNRQKLAGEAVWADGETIMTFNRKEE